MKKERLLELAGVPLKEDEIIAKNTFKIMSKIYDDLERLQSRIDNKSLINSMNKLNLTNERKSLSKVINTAIEEFEDIMPGIEMQAQEDK